MLVENKGVIAHSKLNVFTSALVPEICVVLSERTTCKTVPVGKAALGNAVALVNTKADGVPNAGVINVGLVDNTLLPEPVEVVTPVPPDVTARAFVNVTT